MGRPVIGITCYVEPARFTVWETPAALLPHAYVEHVTRAGGQPVILPPAGDPGALVGRLDGLILAGGGDLDPGTYGEQPHQQTGYIRKFRDEAELEVTQAALAARLPFLGICRGLQILNVALGGTLHQHLPDVVGHTGHAPAPGAYGPLAVRPVAGTRLAGIIEPGDVLHYHHQSVAKLADGLVAAAHADDGTIEAAEHPAHPFTLAVQWHPEAGADPALFDALITAAR
ncbi:gamma-glutamyl-gamma-aminobutyrate hydrolase family protein [Streptosporangium sp. KLBMP 9127]|nr:gamma-glutamyl-gamma-aminobutyrate hydrolase family protein [Streptosporangium sp. KLBMP 9127]